MDQSSEYQFPIFISSTDYNLIDLRAELARYLDELGYRPILSSSEGFPDSSPTLEPWESCLPVLENCFVMILVIDGKYSSSLEWTNPAYKTIFADKKVSPTHGEYLFAHNKGTRMLVFIRSEVLSFYQTYRSAVKKANGNIEEAKNNLGKTLPDTVDFETLQFIHEVKTTKPIPWIKSFDDITSIKKEVQKKMLNELAEIFLIKQKRLDLLVKGLDKAFEGLSSEKKKDVLLQIGYGRELVEKMDELEKKNVELEVTKKGIETAKAQAKAELEIKIKSQATEAKRLMEEIRKLQRDSNIGFQSSGTVHLSDSGRYGVGVGFGPTGPTGIITGSSHFGFTQRCDKCNSNPSISTGLTIGYSLRNCKSCGRNLCTSCWGGGLIGFTDVCSDCNGKQGFGAAVYVSPVGKS